MPSLTDMPNIVMKKILEEVDLKEILALRKVCHDFRNFIDDIKPEAKMNEFEIKIFSTSVEVIYRMHRSRLEIHYEKDKKGCYIMLEIRDQKKRRLVENSNFIDLFIKDLGIIVGFIGQKAILKEIEIGWRYARSNEFIFVLKKIGSVLESRGDRKLKVKDFTMEAFDQKNVLKILPFIDPEPLETIYIRDPCLPDCGVLRTPMQIDELAETEQWKQAAELVMGRHIDVLNMEDFKNFYCVFIEMKTITKETLEEVKKTFLDLDSTNLREFDIEYEQFPDEFEFFRPFGESFREDSLSEQQWFLRIPGSDLFLNMMLWVDGVFHVKFMLFHERHVPRNARIQDWS